MTRYLTMYNLFSSINSFHRKLEIRVQMDSYLQFIHPDGLRLGSSNEIHLSSFLSFYSGAVESVIYLPCLILIFWS